MEIISPYFWARAARRSLSAPGIGVAMRWESGFSQPRMADSGNAAISAWEARASSRAYSTRRKLPSRSPSMDRIWQTATRKVRDCAGKAPSNTMIVTANLIFFSMLLNTRQSRTNPRPTGLSASLQRSRGIRMLVRGAVFPLQQFGRGGVVQDLLILFFPDHAAAGLISDHGQLHGGGGTESLLGDHGRRLARGHRFQPVLGVQE